MEMTNFISIILNQIIDNFDFSFMLIVNAFTYFIIKILDEINETSKVKTYQKRLVLIIAIIIVGALYKLANYPNDIILINSSILAPVFWSWILRPILVKLGLGYKQFNN